MRRERLVFAMLCALAAVAPLPGCGRRSAPSTCGPAADGSVVACVDGAPITEKQVEPYVEPPWWIPGSSVLPDARKEALDRAVRTRLFEAEAKRRKLTLPAGAPDAPASWSQALVAAELAARGITRDAISDEEATREYEANREAYNQLDRVDVLVIAFDDPKLAEKVYADAKNADEAKFRALVSAHSVDEKTKSKGGERTVLATSDEDRQMLKMALSLRKPGALGGPFQAGDGHWYLMRVRAAPIEHAKELDPLLRTTVKNALVDRRRRMVVDELEASLRPRAHVEVFADALAKVPVPASK